MLCKLNQILKYILIGIVTSIAIKYIPTTTLLDSDNLMISFIVAISYAIMDYILPSMKTYRMPSKDTIQDAIQER
jgi:hypothetical protein